MEESQSKIYFGKLASLRFFAALMVVGSHLTLSQYTQNNTVDFVDSNVLWCGFMGVSLFYVLSGFVISLANDRWKDWRRYFIGRVSRIYPSHLLVTATLFAMPLYALITHITREHSASTLFANLALLHAWSPNSNVFFSLNSVSWSLSVEMFFYVMFIFLRRLADRYIYTLAIAGYLATLVGELLLQDKARELTHWMFYILPVTRLPEFMVGMSLFRLYKSGVLQSLRLPKVDFLALLGLLLATAATLHILDVDQLFFYSSLPAPFAAAMVAVLLAEDTSSYMNHRLLVLLGESSFALYLIHKPIVRLPLSHHLHAAGGYGVAFALGLVVVAVALSVVVHLYVERTSTQYTRQGLLRLFIRDERSEPVGTLP